MCYQDLENTVRFESLLIHCASPLYGLKPFFYGCCCSCGVGLWPGCDSVCRVLICLCILPTGNGRPGRTLHEAGLKHKKKNCIFSSLSFGGESRLKLDLLLHASVDKEVCLLSGRSVCSCQHGGHEITFVLKLTYSGT